ncbi:MAG: carotenoid biosynthesis protein [Nitrospira sp.]|nr:carotenoid biosynthesis protein [Nitrospira sp.]
MEHFDLLIKTVFLRPYVFIFLAGFLVSATPLIGWSRTWRLWLISWLTAFLCEFSSTRTGLPFGWYVYTGSTVGRELYISNIPFMDSISFSFLLYAAYCTALCFLLPPQGTNSASRLQPLQFDPAVRNGWRVLLLTSLLFAAIDMVIDPVALQGDRWFLGKLYYYAEDGVHFGVPLSNYVGWMVVGLISLAIYFRLDRRLPPLAARDGTATTNRILMGVGLYYGVLLFNLAVTFWIGETTLGLSGVLMFFPLTVLLILRLTTPRKPLVAGNDPAEFV